MSAVAVWTPPTGTIGTKVPAGWFKATVKPWVDQTVSSDALCDAERRIAALAAAHQALGHDTLELVRARRYVELRMGEMLLDGTLTYSQLQASGIANNSTTFKRFAIYKQAVSQAIGDATDSDELTRAALLRMIDGVDPKKQQKRRVRKQLYKARQRVIRSALRSQQMTKAAALRGDRYVKSRQYMEYLLQSMDALCEQVVAEFPDSQDGFTEHEELASALLDARDHFHKGYDAFGQALKVL